MGRDTPGTLAILGLMSSLCLVSCTGGRSTDGADKSGAVQAGPMAYAALTKAVRDGDETKVRDLLDRGADVNESLGSGPEKVTPLMVAVAKRNPALVRLLIERGANTRNSFLGYTAEDLSIYLGENESARLLGVSRRRGR